MTCFEHERVYTVNDYWDGPRVGVAAVNGKPHYFECIFDEASDDWTDRFWLHAIESEIFELALEDGRFGNAGVMRFMPERLKRKRTPAFQKIALGMKLFPLS